MSVPPEMVGAWRRAGLVVDGEPAPDPCRVLWLQTEEWFADIRLPTPGADAAGATHIPPALREPWAFAGTASWSAPVMTWTHVLDSRAASGPDANPLLWDGPRLIESGTIGAGEAGAGGSPVAFHEVWERVPAVGGTRCAAEVAADRRHVRVEIGHLAVEVHAGSGPSARATLLERRGDRWTEVGSLPDATRDPAGWPGATR